MSIRAGWNLDGKHFAETVGINGRTTYHIDGKMTAWPVWIAAYRAAKAAQATKNIKSGDPK